MKHLSSCPGHLQHFIIGDPVEPPGLAADIGIGGINAVDIGIDIANESAFSAAASATALVSEPPRPRVVMLLL